MTPPTSPLSNLDPAASCRIAQNWLASRSAELTATLTDWANCNTGSENQPGILHLAEIIKAYASFLPVRPQVLHAPSTGQICALLWQYSPRDSSLPRVLFSGHIDTVFGPTHPFQTCYLSPDGKRLHGPGVADMKGGLVILFAALEAFLRSDLKDELAWEVLLTFDEEVGSDQNTAHLIAAAQRNDLGIVFESSPNHSELIRNRMGTGKVEIHCQGQAAHAGRNFHDGRNAILALGQYLAQVADLNTTLPGCIVNVGAMTGGGPINVVPDQADAALNVRAISPEIQDLLMAQLHESAKITAHATGCLLTVTGGFTRPPKVADQATEQLLSAWCRVGRTLGVDIHSRDTGGASDGNILQAAGLPNIDNLGAVGTHLHSGAEFTQLSSLVERAQLNVCFLIHLASRQLDANGAPLLPFLRTPRKETV